MINEQEMIANHWRWNSEFRDLVHRHPLPPILLSFYQPANNIPSHHTHTHISQFKTEKSIYTQYTILSPHTITITNFLPKYYTNLNLCNFFGSSDTAGWVTRWVQIYMKQFSTHFIFIFHTSKKTNFLSKHNVKIRPMYNISIFSFSLNSLHENLLLSHHMTH